MRRIGIFSPGGTGNLGDEATVAVLIEEIKRRCPSAEIYGLTTNPDDTQERHKIPAYPARNNRRKARNGVALERWGEISPKKDNEVTVQERLARVVKRLPLMYGALKIIQTICVLFMNSVAEAFFIGSSFKQIKGTDLLIVAGSGQLCDNFYGVFGFPYTLLKWSIIAKIRGTKLVFLSCGAGPIDSPFSKFFIKCALRLADYRSFRDLASKELIEQIGVKANDSVVPDLVFSSKLHCDEREQSKVIAINAFPHYDHRYAPTSSIDVYESYLNRLASFVGWLIKAGYTVQLFPTQLRADPLVIEDLKAILIRDESLDLKKRLLVNATTSFDDLIAQISTADIVVASRFHGVLISFLLGKPVLALSHHAKVDNLMRDMGQSDYLLNIDTFDLKAAADRLLALESNMKVVKQAITSKVAGNRRRLESQYSELFGMMSSTPDRVTDSVLTTKLV